MVNEAKENSMRLYLDGTKTDHKMKGTVIPKATHREDSPTAPPDQGSLGADFNVHGLIPQNIVIANDDGAPQTVVHMSQRATEIMQAHNMCGPKTRQFPNGTPPRRPMLYAEAAELAKQEAATGVVVTAEAPQVHSSPACLPAVQRAAAGPRTKLKLIGKFGALTIPFDEVFRDGPLLVMIQHDPDGSFFEAPDGEDLVIVELNKSEKLACFPGVAYNVPSQSSRHTVFVVDPDKTAEL